MEMMIETTASCAMMEKSSWSGPSDFNGLGSPDINGLGHDAPFSWGS
jgi:hypothetical protein